MLQDPSANRSLNLAEGGLQEERKGLLLSLPHDQIIRRPCRAVAEHDAARREHDAVGMLRIGPVFAGDGDDAVIGMRVDLAGLADAIAVGVVPDGEAVERWDGCGYPDQLAPDKIPLPARLMAVVDTFDAMTTDRPYRAGLPIDKALAEIESGAGSQFDPECAHAFVDMRPVIERHLGQKRALSQTDLEAANIP